MRFNSLIGIQFGAMLWSVMPVFERGRNSGNSGNNGEFVRAQGEPVFVVDLGVRGIRG